MDPAQTRTEMQRERQKVLLFCAPVILCFLFTDTLALGRFSWATAAVRGLWAIEFVAAAFIYPRLAEPGRATLATLLAVSSSGFYTVLVFLTGGVTSPLFHFMLAMPLIISIVVEDHTAATIAAAGAIVLGGVFVQVAEGLGLGRIAQWIVQAIMMSALASYTSIVYRRLRDRESSARERGKLFELEKSQREAAEAAAERSTFLATAGASLTESLDLEKTLSHITQAPISVMADVSIVDLAETEGHAVSVHGVRIDARAIASTLEGSRIGMSTGGLHAEVSGELLRSWARNAKQRETLERLELASALVIPMTLRGRRLGTIVLGRKKSRARFSAADLDTAYAFAREAVRALENARLYADAQRAIHARDEFLSIASHELRTPLTSLGLQLRILRRAYESEPDEATKLPGRVDVMERQIRRLIGLITNLLDVARLNDDRMTFEPRETDLSEIVREAALRLEEDARRAGTELDLDLESPCTGVWDPLRIDQVVTNLISNAVKYGNRRPITVSLRRLEDDVVLRVKDQGIGIDAADQARIFERFERAVSERHFGGLGLGLWIARQIVESSGGTITVTSSPETGSEFTVRLPATATPVTQTPQSSEI